MRNEMERKEIIGYVGLALFTLVVHLLNLGMIPLLADEPIRATVAFEMIQSGNYLVPTQWGEFYYRKPPLYNWILVGFFKLFGSYDLFIFRLPSVLSHFLLGSSIWLVARKSIGERASLLAAFAFILSGRLLTRDSMLGHIDLTFSLVTFLSFYVIYFMYRKENWFALFVISYFLAACGTLMKGLPSILFQGATLVVWFGYKRNARNFFSLQHLSGTLIYGLMVGGYFYLYSAHNSLEVYFTELFDQAAMRTVAERKWYEGVIQLFSFPFENFIHLFPTSIFLLYLFKKGVLKRWLKNDFTSFTLLTVGINIIPYWLSPGYFPRYLFMLYPLVFILGAEAYEFYRKKSPRLHQLILNGFVVILALLTLSPIAVLFYEPLLSLDGMLVSIVISVLIGSSLIFIWIKQRNLRLIVTLASIAFFRLQFDLFVIPHRVHLEESKPSLVLAESGRLEELTQGQNLRLYGESPFYHDYAYYLGVAKNQIIERTTTIEPGYDYVVDQYLDAGFVKFDTTVVHRFPAYYEDYQLKLVRVNSEK